MLERSIDVVLILSSLIMDDDVVAVFVGVTHNYCLTILQTFEFPTFWTVICVLITLYNHNSLIDDADLTHCGEILKY